VLFVDTLYGIVSFNKPDKAVPVRNMKAHTEVSVNILPHLLYPWLPFNRRLGGFQSWYGHFAEQKILFPLPGIKPQIFQPVGSHNSD
jgi:hypothetical protein